MNIYKVNSFTQGEELVSHFNPEDKCIYYYDFDRNIISSPFKIESDVPMDIYRIKYTGGTIVVFEGDICFAINHPAYRQLAVNIKHWLCRYLPGAVIDGNDIMYNGYKIAAFANHYGYIGINTDTEIVQKVCGIRSKIPKGVAALGIDGEKLKTDFVEFCKNKL